MCSPNVYITCLLSGQFCQFTLINLVQKYKWQQIVVQFIFPERYIFGGRNPKSQWVNFVFEKDCRCKSRPFSPNQGLDFPFPHEQKQAIDLIGVQSEVLSLFFFNFCFLHITYLYLWIKFWGQVIQKKYLTYLIFTNFTQMQIFKYHCLNKGEMKQ